jgi:probable F420-dependent oxidoreductase
MKFSFHLPVDHVSQPGEFLTAAAIAEMARALESAGIDAAYVTEHPAPVDNWLASGGHQALDPFVALSFAAAATDRLRLHTNLVVVPYHNPWATAKAVASLDVLSGGRMIMGIGSGYLEGEFKALNAPFAGRGAVMDEAIDLMKQIWTGRSVTFQGKHFQAEGNTALPAPIQTPHPPIWVGGNSERAIRRAAETCDGWSPFPVKAQYSARVRTDELATIEDLRRKIGQAREWGAKAGRTKPLDICMVPFGLGMQAGTRPEAQMIIDGLAELAAEGVTWSAVAFPCRDRSQYLENVDWFAREVLPAGHGLALENHPFARV